MNCDIANCDETTTDDPIYNCAENSALPLPISGLHQNFELEFKDFTSENKDVYLCSLPEIPREKLLGRDFSLNQPSNVEVTSLDVSAHGCFVVAGCSNGQVILFDISKQTKKYASSNELSTQAQPQPQLIGHIKAKGIHTNLLLSVAITEDCRFCFAGVIKGSSELLAIDVNLFL